MLLHIESFQLEGYSYSLLIMCENFPYLDFCVKTNVETKAWQTFSVKEQIINILGIVGHAVAQLCCFSTKAIIENMQRNASCYVPINLYLQNRQWARFGQRALVWHLFWQRTNVRLLCQLYNIWFIHIFKCFESILNICLFFMTRWSPPLYIKYVLRE
jgi:hypothetical protein